MSGWCWGLSPIQGQGVSASPCNPGSSPPCPVRLTGQTSTGNGGDSALAAEDNKNQGLCTQVHPLRGAQLFQLQLEIRASPPVLTCSG